MPYAWLGGTDDLWHAHEDIEWLAERGALAGVAEVIRERRRQVEVLSHPVEHDDARTAGELVFRAVVKLFRVRRTRGEGTADVGSDEDALRKAGALAAAEIDRLNRMMTGENVSE
jgi:hypothetical protein